MNISEKAASPLSRETPLDIISAISRYRRLHVLLLREGYRLNHKRIYRLYREEGLSIRTKAPKRKRAWRYRPARPEIAGVNHCWAMDFMLDAFFDDRRSGFRRLWIATHAREPLAIVPRMNFRVF
ncbi:MAG: transposase [Afipia sp.]|nr:transposase [Afipia sp.]